MKPNQMIIERATFSFRKKKARIRPTVMKKQPLNSAHIMARRAPVIGRS
jgi:hypothetical protein